MEPAFRRSLWQGVADACGFVLGALAGWWLGRALGFDFVTSPDYDARAMVGLVFIVVGCGVGKWLARRSLRGAGGA
jgi:hypothetical protein